MTTEELRMLRKPITITDDMDDRRKDLIKKYNAHEDLTLLERSIVFDEWQPRDSVGHL